ncbi:MAG TPA: hypothetical protein DDY22_15330 [Geobacter sp.]|nr:hypothetical protein [Geobacter sp.]
MLTRVFESKCTGEGVCALCGRLYQPRTSPQAVSDPPGRPRAP